MATLKSTPAPAGQSPEKAPEPFPALTWETPLPRGSDIAQSLLVQCTWDIEACCRMLVDIAEEMRASEDASDFMLNADMRVRTMGVRILQLNSMLMAYHSEDSVTLQDAHHVLYGKGGVGEVAA